MLWKGKEEFIGAGNMIVWAGLPQFAPGPFLAFCGSALDLTSMYLMTSAQAFGIGSVLIGSVVLPIGRLREDRSAVSAHLGVPILSDGPENDG